MRKALSSIVLIAVLAAGRAHAADADHARHLFLACPACHTEKPDALGPSLRGIVGRKSAAVDEFRYSNPMKRAGLVWDETNLRDYIADPQAKVKGNRTPFGGIAEPKDIDDIVAYLKTLK